MQFCSVSQFDGASASADPAAARALALAWLRRQLRYESWLDGRRRTAGTAHGPRLAAAA
jgi:hypothetical protein